MAADEVQRLDLKDLDAVLERAKAERWTELALLAGRSQYRWADILNRNRLPAERIFVLNEPIQIVPPALLAINSLTALTLRGNNLGDTGAESITSLKGISYLDLNRNEIGDDGAIAISLMPNIQNREMGAINIRDEGAFAIATLK